MMIGTVGVRNLAVSCIIGVNPEERTTEQLVEVDLSIDYDMEKAAGSDDLAAAINYSRVVAMTTELLHWQKFQLLEAAAAHIIAMLYNGYPFIERVTVEIRKPEVLPGTAVSYVRLTR
jgi:FolB domain-containing protein